MVTSRKAIEPHLGLRNKEYFIFITINADQKILLKRLFKLQNKADNKAAESKKAVQEHKDTNKVVIAEVVGSNLTESIFTHLVNYGIVLSSFSVIVGQIQ